MEVIDMFFLVSTAQEGLLFSYILRPCTTYTIFVGNQFIYGSLQQDKLQKFGKIATIFLKKKHLKIKICIQ